MQGVILRFCSVVMLVATLAPRTALAQLTLPYSGRTDAGAIAFAVSTDYPEGTVVAIYGFGSGANAGVQGRSEDGTGVYGYSDTDVGVVGVSGGSTQPGVVGTSSSDAIWGNSSGATKAGVLGTNSAANNTRVGVRGEAYTGVRGQSTATGTHEGTGVLGIGNLYGTYGYSPNDVGVRGEGDVRGVDGYGGSGVGVYGDSQSSQGVEGLAIAQWAQGVYGRNTNSSGGTGVAGRAWGAGYGVYGDVLNINGGYAGYFSGPVHVNGTLSKTGGSFKIDHPQDPENKYLSHSFVESPDMKNIYDGVAVLDGNGEAWVSLPGWFEALNGDFRYQLTGVGQFAPLFVSAEISNNRFKISGGASGMRVSWQVTGIRKDAWANKNRVPVEEFKPVSARGKYLNPEAFNKPASMAENYGREPRAGTVRYTGPIPSQ